MKSLIVVMFFAMFAWGQTTKVVVLRPEEAAKAKQLHEAVVAAQKAADDFDHQITEKYTWADTTPAGPVTWHSIKPEWQYGFEFSDDYLFIVPKPYQKVMPAGCGSLTFPTATFDNATVWR